MKSISNFSNEKILPPNTTGAIYGYLKLEIGTINFLQYGKIDYPRQGLIHLLQFYVRFFGEKENTILR